MMVETAPYHAGELAVQERAGVLVPASRVGRIIGATIPAAAQAFLQSQPLAVAGSVAPDGRVWASLLTGDPGFLQTPDERTVQVAATPAPGDPLGDNLVDGAPIGLLAIEPATRRRVRVNGLARVRPEGFLVEVAEMFANCPKYIQARDWERPEGDALPARIAGRGDALSAAQRDWIAGADTFFIASAHPQAGADASHRGGNPGFVRVADARTLVWPDYAGNNMFQTLGNLTADPRAGLLFLDFARGATLQLTGTARIDWDAARAAAFPGAERLVEFAINETIEIEGASPLRWRFGGYSPFNPA